MYNNNSNNNNMQLTIISKYVKFYMIVGLKFYIEIILL
jgi:hypothetical protein